jgi:hypothetical protein
VAKSVLWLAIGAVALIVVGMVVVSLLGTLLKLGFYLLVGALVVGGGYYLAGKVRGGLRGGRFRSLRGSRFRSLR